MAPYHTMMSAGSSEVAVKRRIDRKNEVLHKCEVSKRMFANVLVNQVEKNR